MSWIGTWRSVTKSLSSQLPSTTGKTRGIGGKSWWLVSGELILNIFFWKLCFQFCQSRRNEFMARSRSSFLMIFFSIDKQFWQDEIFLFMWRQIWSAKPKIIIFCHTWTKNFFSQEYCCAQNCWHLTTKAKLFFSISVLFFVGPLFLKKPVSQLRRIMHKCDSTKHCRRC